MNLLEELKNEHSKGMSSRIVAYIGGNAKRFDELIRLFLKGEPVIRQRAAWPLSQCVEAHPELAKPHLRRLIDNLGTPHLHDAGKRSTVRLLQFIAVPASLQGKVAQHCFGYLSNPKEPIAVRVFSMSVLLNLSLEHEELGQELSTVLEDQLPYSSPGFASRARKVLKAIRARDTKRGKRNP